MGFLQGQLLKFISIINKAGLSSDKITESSLPGLGRVAVAGAKKKPPAMAPTAQSPVDSVDAIDVLIKDVGAA